MENLQFGCPIMSHLILHKCPCFTQDAEEAQEKGDVPTLTAMHPTTFVAVAQRVLIWTQNK